MTPFASLISELENIHLRFITNVTFFHFFHHLTILNAKRSVSETSDQKFIPPAFEKSNLMTFIIIKETLFLPAKYLIMDGELSKVRDIFGPLHQGAELLLPGALKH